MRARRVGVAFCVTYCLFSPHGAQVHGQAGGDSHPAADGGHHDARQARVCHLVAAPASHTTDRGFARRGSLGAQPSARSAAPSAVRMQPSHLDDEDADDVASAQPGGGVLADEPTILLGRRDVPLLPALCRALATRLMLAASQQEGDRAASLPPSLLLCVGLHHSDGGEDEDGVKQALLPLLERTAKEVLGL